MQVHGYLVKEGVMSKILAEDYMPKEMLQEARSQYQESCSKELLSMHISNFLWNMPTIRRYPGILGFDGILKGKTAVIIGAGPSFTKEQIKQLRKVKDNIVVIALDAALPPLKDDIDLVDFVAVVDPTEKQKHNFTDIDTTQFYTIIPPISHPGVFRVLDPKHVAIYNIKDPKSPICEQAPYHTGKIGGLPAGVLTSGSAYGFANVLGCKHIIFLGHDLSWPNTDDIYAKGVLDGKWQFQRQAKFRGGCLLFPDLDGKLVLTHSTFINFWAWLRDYIKATGVHTINSTGAGILKFKGMRIMDLKKSLSMYGQKKIEDKEKKILEGYKYQTADGLIEKVITPPLKKGFRFAGQ